MQGEKNGFDAEILTLIKQKADSESWPPESIPQDKITSWFEEATSSLTREPRVGVQFMPGMKEVFLDFLSYLVVSSEITSELPVLDKVMVGVIENSIDPAYGWASAFQNYLSQFLQSEDNFKLTPEPRSSDRIQEAREFFNKRHEKYKSSFAALTTLYD